MTRPAASDVALEDLVPDPHFQKAVADRRRLDHGSARCARCRHMRRHHTWDRWGPSGSRRTRTRGFRPRRAAHFELLRRRATWPARCTRAAKCQCAGCDCGGRFVEAARGPTANSSWEDVFARARAAAHAEGDAATIRTYDLMHAWLYSAEQAQREAAAMTLHVAIGRCLKGAGGPDGVGGTGS